MKFMKLGSKPDCFQNNGKNIRYAVTELATDIVVHVADVQFYLHKFPLLSKSARLQKLVSSPNGGKADEVHIHDISGGPSAFEICAKFCYGISVNLNAYNVVSVRCAAEYLEMHETTDKGNLVRKIDVFLNSSIFRSWKDSIVLLQTTKKSLPLSEDLKLIARCIDAIATKASVDVSEVDWSYTYNRKKTLEGSNGNYDSVRTRTVPNDWWVEDLCDLGIDLYTRVIVTVKNKGVVSNDAIGEALKAYAYQKLPSSSKGGVVVKTNDVLKLRAILDTIVWLLPAEKGSVSCSFLLKLLKAAISVNSGETMKMELVKRIGKQLEEASINDLLIRACDGGETIYDALIVKKMLEVFITQDSDGEIEMESGGEIREIGRARILSEAPKMMVAKLIDGYLGEVAKDPNLPLSMFLGMAEMVSSFSRPAHDGLYRAIDTYLKEHPGISKNETKRICRLMDCKKLSPEACTHAVQNERLPLRVVLQVLFFEQVRAAAAASSGGSTPDLPKAIKELNCGSSRSATTNNDEDSWDAVASAEELRTLRGELANLRLRNGVNSGDNRIGKMKGMIMSKKIFSKMRSSKENSGSDSSDSLGSTNHEEAPKCTPTRRVRRSVS